MVPLPMGVRHELVEGAAEPTLAEQGQAVEILRAARAHEALSVSSGSRAGMGVGPIRTPAPSTL